MESYAKTEARELLDRIARINASEDWQGDVNPTQRAALSYLARANRFSRMPSQVAEYLSATRGTTSQTLKALARKGLIVEHRSKVDKRSISYEITTAGHNTLNAKGKKQDALEHLAKEDIENVTVSLKKLIETMLHARGGRSFGICESCRHHQQNEGRAYCGLLKVTLKPEDVGSICHEHEYEPA